MATQNNAKRVSTGVVRIYPVVGVRDFVYGHRCGWLDALLQAAEGFMLRPEREPAFAVRLTLRRYLARRYDGVRLGWSSPEGLDLNTIRRIYAAKVRRLCLSTVQRPLKGAKYL